MKTLSEKMKVIALNVLPVLSICIFILIMTTGSFLKGPLLGDDDVLHYTKNVKENIKEEKWDQAYIELKKAQKSLRKIIKRIQFSSERNEINSLMMKLNRVEGYIEGKDMGGALAEILEVEYIWSELGD